MYAIMIDYYHCKLEGNPEDDIFYKVPCYLGVDENTIIIFEPTITARTKIFTTATEAGQYLDKHFACGSESYGENTRIVKLYKEFD